MEAVAAVLLPQKLFKLKDVMPRAPAHRRLSVVAAETERDPVCGMTVSAAAPERASLDGQTYFFCCAGCRAKFEAAPRAYVGVDASREAAQPAHPSAPASAQGPGEAGWTCPMHPEVRRDRPGDCPICGMALEPIAPVAASDDNPELTDMKRRFWVSAALTLPVVTLAMAMPMKEGPGPWVPWVEAILAGIVVLWGGRSSSRARSHRSETGAGTCSR